MADRLNSGIIKCPCPPGQTLIENGLCQEIVSIPATPPSVPVTIGEIPYNNLYTNYGAVIYEDLSQKQWPIIASVQGGSLYSTNTNTIIPFSGPNPNPYLFGGGPYEVLNPGTDGINYTGGLGTNGQHATIILPLPVSYPPIPLPGVPYRAFRESTITGLTPNITLNYGIGNVVNPQFRLTNDPWTANAVTGWMNNRGISSSLCLNCVNNPLSACEQCKQWYGFTHCINITTTKTYYIALGANNAFRLKINNNLVVEFNIQDGGELSLANASIFPITLPAGIHVLNMEYLNYSGDGGLAFEIFDCTLAELQSVMSLAQLQTYTIFSAIDSVGNIYDTSTFLPNSYTCPEGYIYSNCNGSPECIQINTSLRPPTNIKLSPCCGTGATYIVSHEDFPNAFSSPGWTACIEDLDPLIGCWSIEETCDHIDYIAPFTINEFYFTCAACLESGECKTCINNYFILKDCCTGEEYMHGDQQYVLQYTGLPSTTTPDDFATSVITDLTDSEGEIIKGCYNLTPIDYNDISLNPYIVGWDAITSIKAVENCAACQSCDTCYTLVNCANATDTLIVTTDLSAYINHIVSIAGCSDKKWIVYASECITGRCDPSVIIVGDCPPIDGPEKYCQLTTTVSEIEDTSGAYIITIDGIEYPLVYDFTVAGFLAALNALNLGIWSTLDDEHYYVIGDHVYNNYCYNPGLNGPSKLPPLWTCNILPCDIPLKICTYDISSIDLTDPCYNYIQITINSINYNLGLLATNAEIALAINGLALGIAETFLTTLNIAGSYTYGQLLVNYQSTDGLCITPKPSVVFNPTCQTIPPGDINYACCETPAPIIQPVPLLNTRFVAPGYKTPGCSPEYTERINCAFGKLMYDKMLVSRYGITPCCEDTDTDWQIKKALLDFEAIKDK
jgi:hypothetical protein